MLLATPELDRPLVLLSSPSSRLTTPTPGMKDGSTLPEARPGRAGPEQGSQGPAQSADYSWCALAVLVVLVASKYNRAGPGLPGLAGIMQRRCQASQLPAATCCVKRSYFLTRSFLSPCYEYESESAAKASHFLW